MQSHRARLALVGFLLMVGVGVTAFAWSVQQQYRALMADQTDVQSRLEAMSATVGDIAAAQQAYLLAPSDLDEQWLERISSLIREVSDEGNALAPLTRSGGAGDALRTVLDSAAALTRVDARARQNLRPNRDQVRTDLVAEGRDILDSMLVELRNLRFAEGAAFENARAAALRPMWAALGASVLLWAIGLLFLARTPHAAPAAEPPTLADPMVDPNPVVEAVARREPPLDLEAAASLCRDLSRVAAPGFPELLRKAAGVLQASGAVVWIGAEGKLLAAASHGYTPEVLDRFGPIAKSDDNVTAAAWRTGELRAVGGDEPAARGALAVPLFDPERCFGVLALELLSGRERDPDVQAVATMIGAQLATVVSGWSAATPQTDVPAETPLEASGM
jgi:GAF domain-containing protein